MHEISEGKWYRLAPRIVEILLLDAAQKENVIHALNCYFKVRGADSFTVFGRSVWQMPFCPWRRVSRQTSIAAGWLIEVDWLDEFPTEEQLEVCRMLGVEAIHWPDDQK